MTEQSRKNHQKNHHKNFQSSVEIIAKNHHKNFKWSSKKSSQKKRFFFVLQSSGSARYGFKGEIHWTHSILICAWIEKEPIFLVAQFGKSGEEQIITKRGRRANHHRERKCPHACANRSRRSFITRKSRKEFPRGRKPNKKRRKPKTDKFHHPPRKIKKHQQFMLHPRVRSLRLI